MDGNGRWAQNRGLPRLAGHERGARSVRKAVELHRELEIPYLTLYAFSTENWKRPDQEVLGLMDLLAHWAESERQELIDQQISMHLIGEPHRLSPHALCSLNETVRATKRPDPITTLTLALSYGGRSEITRAAASISEQVQSGNLRPEDLQGPEGEQLFSSFLDTAPLPDPDLVIRTGGDIRISNFLLFQSAYSEWFFRPEPWPSFGKHHFLECFEEMAQRVRRFGQTDDQLLLSTEPETPPSP